MPRTSSPDGLADLLEKQSSVVSRGQLLTLGMKDNAMQYRVRRGGPWQTLLPGVYLTVNGVPSFSQKEMAALLYAGPGSLITGPTALMHHSIRSGSAVDIIDVLVPIGRQRVSAGFARLHRTARMPVRASSAGPVRLTLVPRAVADTARQLSELRDVRAVVADAVQLGRCTVSQLADELRTGPVRGSAAFRSVLAEVADGIRSTAEGDLRDVVKTARLPMPLFNPSLYDGDLFLGKPDGWWPDAGVAGEVDSRAWHLSPDDWDRTRRRHDRMAAAGIIVLHFSPRELRREPAKVADLIKGALNRGLTRPLSPSAPSRALARFNERGVLPNSCLSPWGRRAGRGKCPGGAGGGVAGVAAAGWRAGCLRVRAVRAETGCGLPVVKPALLWKLSPSDSQALGS